MVSLVRGFSAIRTFKESSLRLTISNRARNYLIHNFALLACPGLYNHSSPGCYNRFEFTSRAPAEHQPSAKWQFSAVILFEPEFSTKSNWKLILSSLSRLLIIHIRQQQKNGVNPPITYQNAPVEKMTS